MRLWRNVRKISSLCAMSDFLRFAYKSRPNKDDSDDDARSQDVAVVMIVTDRCRLRNEWCRRGEKEEREEEGTEGGGGEGQGEREGEGRGWVVVNERAPPHLRLPLLFCCSSAYILYVCVSSTPILTTSVLSRRILALRPRTSLFAA